MNEYESDLFINYAIGHLF